MTRFRQFKVLNDVMYGDVLEHGGLPLLYIFTLRISASSEGLKVIAVVSTNIVDTVYCTVNLMEGNI